MNLLENLFKETIETFHLSKEELKETAEFNFDVYDMRGFESIRGVFRIAQALSEVGFTEFAFMKGKGLADLRAIKDGQPWVIEVKTLVLQTKAKKIEFNGTAEVLDIDKFQPESGRVEEYVENVSRQIAGNLIGKARQLLLETTKGGCEAKKMIGLVVNLLAGDFLDYQNLGHVYARFCGQFDKWEKNYLDDVDALAFLTYQLHLFP
jgi:hypothetical protein